MMLAHVLMDIHLYSFGEENSQHKKYSESAEKTSTKHEYEWYILKKIIFISEDSLKNSHSCSLQSIPGWPFTPTECKHQCTQQVCWHKKCHCQFSAAQNTPVPEPCDAENTQAGFIMLKSPQMFREIAYSDKPMLQKYDGSVSYLHIQTVWFHKSLLFTVCIQKLILILICV